MMLLERHHPDRVRVYASAALSDFPQTRELAKDRLRKFEILDKKKTIAKVNGTNIDYSWLKGASETYQISPDIKDYILSEVPIVSCDFPNRNLHSFPMSEVSYFDPRFGQFVYKTFTGKPTYADHCFSAGTMIETIDGLKPIEQIQIGDQVLTDKMRYKPVTELFNNGVKPVTKLKIQGIMEPLFVTENHPVLVVDRRQIFGRYDAKNQTYRTRLRKENFRDVTYKPHFRPVSDVYPGDYVAIPINYGGDVLAVKSLAFLAGAYLADGSFVSKSEIHPDGNTILFTIGNHRKEFRDAIIEHAITLGYKPYYRPLQTQGCDWIMIHSPELCETIKSLCGEYSEHKKIQGDARHWDIESTRLFLGAYMSGDGGFDVKKGSFRVRTSSKNLLKDLQQAFAFIGIPSCVGIDMKVAKYIRKENKWNIHPTCDSGYLRISQYFIPEIMQYTVGKDITIIPSKADSGRGIISGNLLLMPILKIEEDAQESEVFNLEVEEDHTYVAGSIIVHNCNKSFPDAKGVHFDASLRYIPGWDVWKIYVLLGYDRTKDTSLARQIEKGTRRSYSMGSWVSYFLSSINGQLSNGSQPLKYPKGTVHNGMLSYDNCCGCEYFECLADTPVRCIDGISMLKDLQVGNTVYDEFGKPIKVKQVFYNGKKPVVDLMSNGKIMASCTLEHRWLVKSVDGITIVKRVSDFSLGDKIVVISEQGEQAELPISVGVTIREEDTFDIHVDSNTNLYMLANGMITHNTSSVVGPADVTAESHQLWYF
jgi:hypothetical protein